MIRSIAVAALGIAFSTLACLHERPDTTATPPSVPGAEAIPPPPPTRRADVRETIHGVEFVDSYRWLEDQNSPETRAWIEAQSGYTLSLLENRPSRKPIQDRLSGLIRIDRTWAPIERGGRRFLFKRKADEDLSILYLRAGFSGEDEVLIDPHPMSPDHTTTITLMDVSHDGKLVAYGVRRGGEDEVEPRLLDVDLRSDLPDGLPRGLYGEVSIDAGGKGFYYALRDRTKGTRIRYHAMGTPASGDREIFGEGHGPGDWIGASVSEDGRYLLIPVFHGWKSSEIYIQDLRKNGPITPIVTGLDALFDPAFAGGTLILKTDWQAPKGRILAVDPEHPARERWREIVRAGDDPIENFSAAGGKLFVQYLHDVSSKIEIFSIEGARLGRIELPGIGTAGPPTGRWESREAFFDYFSFTSPRTTYRYDTATEKIDVWSRDEAPVDPERFEVKQVWYLSKDGTRVPMFLVHRKGLVPDGQRPTLLYGYGGFNVSITPSFNNVAVWLAENDGVFAAANLRGGGEFGEEWHRAGMLGNKQNVFDDFIAAAEWLIAKGWTSPSKLGIRGGSNGGLLVGSALTQRPDLFRAVLCEYPDLDMIRYPLFQNNNPPALLEYGDARDPEQFRFLHAYSPYQRVKKGTAYPAVLLTSGDEDTRVPPLQARKMTAALQGATSSGRPVLLLYDTRSGHSGGKPLGKVVEDLSLEVAFLAWQLGMESP